MGRRRKDKNADYRWAFGAVTGVSHRPMSWRATGTICAWSGCAHGREHWLTEDDIVRRWLDGRRCGSFEKRHICGRHLRIRQFVPGIAIYKIGNRSI